MKKLVLSMLALSVIMLSCTNEESNIENMESSPISENTTQELSDSLKSVYPNVDALRIEKGVQQAASLWRDSDGTKADFRKFVAENFIIDAAERRLALKKLERNFEILNGYFHRMDVDLQEPLHLDMGKLHELDYKFGSYSASSHMKEDFYANKIAFYVALNFPAYSL